MLEISVVILTSNRLDALKRCLHSLEQGELTPAEVIVVDNGSEDGTREFLDSAAFSFVLKVLDGAGGSFSEARNIGFQGASSEWIAFTDDDCEADPFWLSQLAQSCISQGWKACGGIVIPADELEIPVWFHPGLSWTIGCHSPIYLSELAGRLEIPTTSNILFHRSLGERFPFRELKRNQSTETWNYEYSREDAEFWRSLRRAGISVGVNQKSIIWHHIDRNRIDWERNLERARQDGRGHWNREKLREEVPSATNDIVFSPLGAVQESLETGIPLEEAWAVRRTWLARQWAFLDYATRDHNQGVSTTSRLLGYLKAVGRLTGSLVQTAARPLLRDILKHPQIDEKPKSLGVVLYDKMGDGILSLPLLESLESTGSWEVTILTGDTLAPLLEQHFEGSALRIIRIPAEARGESLKAGLCLKSFLSSLHLDCLMVIYCHGLNPLGFFLNLQLPVISWSFDNGFDRQLWGDLVSVKIEKNWKKHEVVALLDFLQPLGLKARCCEPVLRLSKGSGRVDEIIHECVGSFDFVLMHVESEVGEKFWSPEKFLAIADHARSEGLGVIVIGSRHSRIELEAEFLKVKAVHLGGFLNSVELAELASRARMFIGCDSGPAHLAKAVGCPSIILFGMTQVHRWGEFELSENKERIRYIHGGPGDWLDGEKLGMEMNKGVEIIDVESVKNAFNSMIQD